MGGNGGTQGNVTVQSVGTHYHYMETKAFRGSRDCAGIEAEVNLSGCKSPCKANSKHVTLNWKNRLS